MSTTTARLDDLDRAILKTLMEDARTPYAEMAKQFDVSPATIHVRIEKMRSADIIERTEVVVNTKNWVTTCVALLVSTSMLPKITTRRSPS